MAPPLPTFVRESSYYLVRLFIAVPVFQRSRIYLTGRALDRDHGCASPVPASPFIEQTPYTFWKPHLLNEGKMVVVEMSFLT